MMLTIEARLANLEKVVEELKNSTPRAASIDKDWHRTVGTVTDNELAREADRLGAEWRRTANLME